MLVAPLYELVLVESPIAFDKTQKPARSVNYLQQMLNILLILCFFCQNSAV